MTKKLILAMFALSAVTFGSFAADNKADNNKGVCNENVNCHKQKCDRKDRVCPNPFEGLNLTETQKTQLDELRASMPCNKGKQKNDKNEGRVDRKQCKRDFLAKVKTILTPEQYVTFLENNFADRGARKHDGYRKGHGQKRHNVVCQGNNCDNNRCKNANNN